MNRFVNQYDFICLGWVKTIDSSVTKKQFIKSINDYAGNVRKSGIRKINIPKKIGMI